MSLKSKTSKVGVSDSRKSSKEPSPELNQNVNTIHISAPKYGTVIPDRVFVGGISAHTTENELNEFFSKYGKVTDSKIIYDRGSVSKGYGFITFASEQEAKHLLDDADNVMLRERKLNIAPAIKKQNFSSVDVNVVPGGTTAGGTATLFPPPVTYTYHNGVAYFQPAAPPQLSLPPPTPPPTAHPPLQQHMDPNLYTGYATQISAPYHPVMYNQPVYYQQPQYQYSVPCDGCTENGGGMVDSNGMLMGSYYVPEVVPYFSQEFLPPPHVYQAAPPPSYHYHQPDPRARFYEPHMINEHRIVRNSGPPVSRTETHGGDKGERKQYDDKIVGLGAGKPGSSVISAPNLLAPNNNNPLQENRNHPSSNPCPCPSQVPAFPFYRPNLPSATASVLTPLPASAPLPHNLNQPNHPFRRQNKNNNNRSLNPQGNKKRYSQCGGGGSGSSCSSAGGYTDAVVGGGLVTPPTTPRSEPGSSSPPVTPSSSSAQAPVPPPPSTEHLIKPMKALKAA